MRTMPYPGEPVDVVDLSLSQEPNPREFIVKRAHILPVLYPHRLLGSQLALT